MKLFLDTNIWLRYFVRDDEKMYQLVVSLLQAVHAGMVKPAVSTIVLMEIMYTLRSFYTLPKEQVTRCVREILSLPAMKVVEKTTFLHALDLSIRHNQKISDCLIATQVPPGYKLCSFDADLAKLVGKSHFVSPEAVRGHFLKEELTENGYTPEAEDSLIRSLKAHQNEKPLLAPQNMTVSDQIDYLMNHEELWSE